MDKYKNLVTYVDKAASAAARKAAPASMKSEYTFGND
jgi:hypothetical protein